MSIRSEAERAAAVARMQEMVAATRCRSMTDDEQRAFDILVGDVGRFDGRTSAETTGTDRSYYDSIRAAGRAFRGYR